MNENAYLYSIMKTSYIHTTQHLSIEQVKRLFKAGQNAFNLGRPLNRFITIHYDDYADKKRPQKFVVELLNHIRKWLNRHGLPVAYLYTLENGKIKGIHVHLLLHIPNGCQIKFKRAMVGWLPFEVKRPRVAFKSIQYPCYGKLTPMNGFHGILKYMCKGVDPQTSSNQINAISQGEIMGRRWGISTLIR